MDWVSMYWTVRVQESGGVPSISGPLPMHPLLKFRIKFDGGLVQTAQKVCDRPNVLVDRRSEG